MPLTDKNISRNKSFDWDKAKTFYYIVKFGSFSRACKFLNIAQSAISRQIGILESDLKCKLLIRLPRGIKATRKGEQLFTIIEESYIKLKGFTNDLHPMTVDGTKRIIRISTTHPIATYILSNCIISSYSSNANIVFDIIANNELIDIAVNDVDLAIRPYDSTTVSSVQEHLFTLEKKLFASDKYIEKYGEPKTIDELKNHFVVAHSQPEKYPYSDLKWILNVGMPNGKSREPVFTSNSLEMLVSMCKEGVGIMGGYEEMTLIQNSKLKRILPSVKGPVSKYYISYPDHLVSDVDFMKTKNHILESLSQYKYNPEPITLK